MHSDHRCLSHIISAACCATFRAHTLCLRFDGLNKILRYVDITFKNVPIKRVILDFVRLTLSPPVLCLPHGSPSRNNLQFFVTCCQRGVSPGFEFLLWADKNCQASAPHSIHFKLSANKSCLKTTKMQTCQWAFMYHYYPTGTCTVFLLNYLSIYLYKLTKTKLKP